MIEDHGHCETFARRVRWNQNLLPNQCSCKIVYLESYMRNGLDRLGIRRVRVKSHPLNATWTGSKTRNVNVQVGHVNLIRARSLRGNSDVVITPAMPRNGSWGFVVLSQILRQAPTLLRVLKVVRFVRGALKSGFICFSRCPSCLCGQDDIPDLLLRFGQRQLQSLMIVFAERDDLRLGAERRDLRRA